jgi:hypothetical protein
MRRSFAALDDAQEEARGAAGVDGPGRAKTAMVEPGQSSMRGRVDEEDEAEALGGAAGSGGADKYEQLARASMQINAKMDQDEKIEDLLSSLNTKKCGPARPLRAPRHACSLALARVLCSPARRSNGSYSFEKHNVQIARTVAIPRVILDQYEHLKCASFLGTPRVASRCGCRPHSSRRPVPRNQPSLHHARQLAVSLELSRRRGLCGVPGPRAGYRQRRACAAQGARLRVGVRACVRACVRVRACMRVRTCVRVC